MWPEVGSFLSTVVAAGIGSWLTVRFFPLQAKKDEWEWQRRTEAQEFVFDSLSQIVFLSHNLVKSYLADDFSMSGKGLNESEKTIYDLLRGLHGRKAGLGLHLEPLQKEILDEFAIDSQDVLDAANKTWGLWHHDDHESEVDHRTGTLSDLAKCASRYLERMEATLGANA
ncbi:hypothetical protein [Alcanivorax sp.]|uniref:hypothetical protein n=1 Tax=Alcanivorax sp. TaxID=1872427 RepID=UPI002620A79C|nr:hypothetical protein [Alcanivorax sp.]